MSGAFNAKRSRRRPTINITSLIDVMFLLLIFFMVSSTFREQFGIEVTLPEAETAERRESEPHELVVARDGSFYFGQQAVDAEQLRTALMDLLGADPDAPIVLRADEGADFGSVVAAIDIARAAGGRQLVLPTRIEQEVNTAAEAP